MEPFSGPFVCFCFCSETGDGGAANGRWTGSDGCAADWQRIAGLRTGFRNLPHAARQRLLRTGFSPLAARQHLLRAGSAALPACRNLALFRSHFDSGKARQTVRWSRFSGLEFAPVFAVKQAMAARQTDAEQAAMAARQIGSASPGCERVPATFRTPQGSACCEPVFRPLATSQRLLRAGSAASPACWNLAFFAPDLIAARPVKSCDRAVFQALNLLPFLQ